MNETSIAINKAILHIIDPNFDFPFLSNVELDKEGEVWDFLENHLRKSFASDSIRAGRFSDDDYETKLLVESISDDSFVSVSAELAKVLFNLVKKFSLPPSDLIFTLVKINQEEHLAILKFNYKETYIHYIENSGDSTHNKLIKQKTTLPSETQKVDECIFVNLHNLDIKILEKSYEIDGEKEFYLSTRFLKCANDLSTKEKVAILTKSVRKVCKKYSDDDFDKVVEFQTAVSESAEESNAVQISQVANAVFKEPGLQKEYLEEVQKAGLKEDVVHISEESSTLKRLGRNKIKTNTGIEINFPSHCYSDKDMIDFINNPDGTISILIKNVSIENKK
ncbi:nucleoid-associated protein [Dethiobacter alkaliphilus]|uniref:37kDa nucleoid-associated protein n=1 Tax=Dethiobacter alkaliphilus AHT 1 TaxID=555088 RepID=C0GKS8_DETAL|nr:nucleoid-associated protein [Dethiobacter alkaliphilus]EEG76047.1 conserved hypothetical protein [Dethiobacter alkaliphilus AHT 1]